MAETYDQLPRTILALRGVDAALPANESVRLDMPGNLQLWVAYMMSGQPLCSLTPLTNTQYPHVPVSRAEVKVRHRSEPIRASVEVTSDGFRLELDEPAFAVARGQFAVLYDSDAVVGAGAIADVA